MEWINVKDEHFAEITHHKDGGYSWIGEIDTPFMVAVPLNEGWFIEKVVLTDLIGLQISFDDEIEEFPYDMNDVTHWAKITTPKQ